MNDIYKKNGKLWKFAVFYLLSKRIKEKLWTIISRNITLLFILNEEKNKTQENQKTK